MSRGTSLARAASAVLACIICAQSLARGVRQVVGFRFFMEFSMSFLRIFDFGFCLPKLVFVCERFASVFLL